MSSFQRLEVIESSEDGKQQNNLGGMLYQFIQSILKYLSQFNTQTIQLNSRKLKVIRRIGEGGFSFVYLVV